MFTVKYPVPCFMAQNIYPAAVVDGLSRYVQAPYRQKTLSLRLYDEHPFLWVFVVPPQKRRYGSRPTDDLNPARVEIVSC